MGEVKFSDVTKMLNGRRERLIDIFKNNNLENLDIDEYLHVVNQFSEIYFLLNPNKEKKDFAELIKLDFGKESAVEDFIEGFCGNNSLAYHSTAIFLYASIISFIAFINAKNEKSRLILISETYFHLGLAFGHLQKTEVTIDNINLSQLIKIIPKLTLSNRAKKAVFERLKNDPKQVALRKVEQDLLNCNYHFNKRGYRAKFCKEMLEKYTEIKDIKTIERLFDRLNKAKNTPSAS